MGVALWGVRLPDIHKQYLLAISSAATALSSHSRSDIPRRVFGVWTTLSLRPKGQRLGQLCGRPWCWIHLAGVPKGPSIITCLRRSEGVCCTRWYSGILSSVNYSGQKPLLCCFCLWYQTFDPIPPFCWRGRNLIMAIIMSVHLTYAQIIAAVSTCP